ncbi:hypothetical protein IAT40_002232 [Kwoniella sp. CBS 6097]
MLYPTNSLIALIPIFLGMMWPAASSPAPTVPPASVTITAAPVPRFEKSHKAVFADDTTMTLTMKGLDRQGLYIHNEDGSYASQDLGAFMPNIEWKFDKDHRSQILTAAFYDEAKVEKAINGPSMTDTAAKAEWFKTADRYTYTQEAPTKLYECTAAATEVRQDVQVTVALTQGDAPFLRPTNAADMEIECNELPLKVLPR